MEAAWRRLCRDKATTIQCFVRQHISRLELARLREERRILERDMSTRIQANARSGRKRGLKGSNARCSMPRCRHAHSFTVVVKCGRISGGLCYYSVSCCSLFLEHAVHSGFFVCVCTCCLWSSIETQEKVVVDNRPPHRIPPPASSFLKTRTFSSCLRTRSEMVRRTHMYPPSPLPPRERLQTKQF